MENIKSIRGIVSRPQADPVSMLAIAMAGGGFAVPTAAQFFIAKLIVGAVVSIATSALSAALIKPPKPPSGNNFTRELKDRTLTARQPIAPRRMIFGQVRVGGVFTFIHTTGDKKEFLHSVITVSGHQLDDFVGMFFDGEEVPFIFEELWLNQFYAEDEIVFSNGSYYQRNATSYPQNDITDQNPVTDTLGLWVLGGVGGSEWSAIFYNENDVVFVIGIEGDTHFTRTAVVYPTEDDVSDRPEDAPSLWVVVPNHTSDNFIATGKYAGFVDGQFNLGTQTQTAFTNLVERVPDKWTTNHRQAGCAGAYLRLKYDPDKFPNGLPSITFEVKGKNDIFDPRTSTSGYTTNSALCLADYIANTELGLGAAYSTEILDADLIEAANICDELVALREGETEARYTTNGTFETDSTPFENIQSLASAMAGAAITQGKFWTIRAGAYRTQELPSLTEGDFIGPLDIQTLTTRVKSFNGVKGVFTSPSNSWQPDDFPPVQVQQYVDDDNGDENWAEITMPFTISESAAQRISRLMLEDARRQITVSMPVKMIAYQLQPYDTIGLTIERYGWTDKTFQVRSMQLVIDKTWSVRLSLKETDANIYAWTTVDQSVFPAAPTTSLPSPFVEVVPGITLSDEVVVSPTGNASTSLIATIQAVSDAFAEEYEVQHKLSSSADWIFSGRSPALIYTIPNVVDQETYDVRVRAVSVVNTRSTWVQSQRTIIGQADLPPDVDEFSVAIVDGAANLTWSPVDVIDLSHYRVKYSPKITGATWAEATLLVNRVGKPATSITVPALVGTYLIKAVDYGNSGDGTDGRESENATLIISNVAALRTFNVVETIQEDPTFAGVKENVVDTGSGLTLGYQEDIFTRADFFGVGDYFLGTLGFYDEGFYYFDNSIDLGGVYTSRVTATIAASGSNQAEDIFTRADFFGVTDVFGGEVSQWGVVLQVRTTEDLSVSPVVWSAWQPFITGDYVAEGIQFRAKLTSSQFGVTPIVTGLAVAVDMPDENRSDDDLVVSVAGLSVSFAPAFKQAKGVAISAQGLATGDYYSLTNKDALGFDIQFFNSADAAVQRTFDYVAVGFGRLN